MRWECRRIARDEFGAMRVKVGSNMQLLVFREWGIWLALRHFSVKLTETEHRERRHFIVGRFY